MEKIYNICNLEKKVGILMKDINEIVASLRVHGAVESYPRLQGLQYFRRLNDFIENTCNENIEEINDRNNSRNKEGEITPQRLLELNEGKKYKSFQNFIRPSLLITLCSFIEDVFTNRINSDKELKKKFNNLPKEKIGCINKANNFLVNNGFVELNNIEGITYVYEMYLIRNRFVHNKGEATKKIKEMQKKYDFTIEKNKILLGEKFIENYIAHLEKFAVEVAKIIYVKKSRFSKFQKDKSYIGDIK